MQIIKYRADRNAEWQDILALRGADGKDGENYIITEEDKQEIADMVLANFVSGEEVAY